MKSWSIMRRYFRSTGTRKHTRHTHKRRFPVRTTSYLGSINVQQALPGHSKTDRHASGSACHAEHLRPQKNWGSCQLEPMRGQALLTRRTHIESWSSQRAQASQDQRVAAASPSADGGGTVHSKSRAPSARSHMQRKSSAVGVPSPSGCRVSVCFMHAPSVLWGTLLSIQRVLSPASTCSGLLRGDFPVPFLVFEAE